MKKTLLSIFLAVSAIGNAQITTSSNTYTTDQLITDVLLSGSPTTATNINSSSAINFTNVNSLGYFTQNGSTFPFEDGIILTTGSIVNAPGPNTTSQSGGSWPGDSDLQDIIPGANQPYQNATSISFDFVAVLDNFSLNYIFASEEYGTFQCAYGDAFAIILTDLSTGSEANIAIIPGTVVPVSAGTVRNNLYNSNCPSVNPQYFADYYTSSDLSAPVNFNGITVPMTATASIIPGNTYNLKIVIGDYADSAYDSALFIQSGNFNVGYITNIGTPDDLVTCDDNNDGSAMFELTSNNEVLLADLDPASHTVTYHETFGDAMSNQNIITTPAAYMNVVAFTTDATQVVFARVTNNIDDSFGVASFGLFVSPMPVAGDVETIAVIDVDGNGMEIVNLTSAESQILEGTSPNGFVITFHISLLDAMEGLNVIVDPTAYATMTSTVYFRLEDIQTGCYVVHPLEIVVLPSDYVTEEPEGASAQNFTPGETLADLEVEGENIQWYATAGDTAGRDANDNDDIPLSMNTLLQDNTTYYATQTVYGIESIERFPVTAHAALGVNEATFTSLTYYPNPVKDVLTLSNNENIEEVVIYNLLGQVVFSKTINEREISLNLSSITEGIYIVKVTSEGVEKTFKIVKE